MSNQNLRKAGLKVTVPRLKILEILERSPQRHMSAEDIYRQLQECHEEVGLATVYRVLTQFETAGLITRHNFEGGHSVFELNMGEHHDHLVCINCGLVEEFFDEVIEQRQQAIASRLGFSISGHALTLYGICGAAQQGICPKRAQITTLHNDAVESSHLHDRG